MKCYICGQLGHPAYRCPEKPSSSNQSKKVAYVQEDCTRNKETNINHLDFEKGENLMCRRLLIKQPDPNETRKERHCLELSARF